MQRRTFNELVEIIKSACNRNFYSECNYNDVPKTIIECATKIYLKEMELAELEKK